MQKKVTLEGFSSKAKLKKYLSVFPEVEQYLDVYMGTLQESEGDTTVRNNTLNLLVSLVFEEEVLTSEESDRLFRLAQKGFEFQLLWVEQKSLRDRLPQEIRKVSSS